MAPTTYSVDRWDGKVNYNPTQNSMIWAGTAISPMDIVAPLILGPAGGDAILPAPFSSSIIICFSTWSFYARDSWQASPQWPIDYGMRWQYYPIYSHDRYAATRFEPATDDIYVGGEDGVWDAGAMASKKGFGPRLRVNEKTIIRSGHSISQIPTMCVINAISNRLPSRGISATEPVSIHQLRECVELERIHSSLAC